MTDNKVIIDENGKESVMCNRSDGWGIKLLKENGIETVCISSEKNNVVKNRCLKLEIEFYTEVYQKGDKIKYISKKKGIPLKNIAYIGNDINDIPALKLVGLPIVVNDANIDAIEHSKIILNSKGGNGAILEFAKMKI